MTDAEITVIMPVYNAGDYLREALESVLAQDFTDYKLYCVDDCSDDGSYETLLKYEKKYDKIHVFRNQERMGAAYSRNFALKMVDSIYVKFVDADDIVEPNQFSQLYEAIIKYEADIAYCEWDKFRGDVGNIIETSLYPYTEQERKRATYPHRLKDLLLDNALKITNAPWVFLIRSAFLKKKSLNFQSLATRNDVYFFEMSKMLADKLVHTSSFQALAHQREHQSVSQIGNNPNPIDIFSALGAVKDKMLYYGIWGEYQDYYFTRCISSMAHAVRTADKRQKKQFLMFLREKGLLQLGVSIEAIDRSNVPDKILEIYKQLLYGAVADIEGKDSFYNRLLDHKESIQRQLHSWKAKKIAFWGIGRRMQCFWELFKDDMDFYICFVDVRKSGELYEGREIVRYGQVANKNDIIVLLNNLHERDVIAEINSSHGEEQVFNLDKFMEQNMREREERRE